MSFSYCLPILVEFRKDSPVGATVVFHVSSGGLYFPLPPKSSKIFASGDSIIGPDFLLSLFSHTPCTFAHPLLKPGSTRFISSPYAGPFSVSHSFLVTGSKSIPKLLRIPYA